jgi:hypothetical protein
LAPFVFLPRYQGEPIQVSRLACHIKQNILLFILIIYSLTKMADKQDTNQPKTYRKSKFEEAELPTDRREETSTFKDPTPPLEAKEKSLVHNKVWLYIFLVHTLAYVGITAYINYVAVTNDKQPITGDASLGPIDM